MPYKDIEADRAKSKRWRENHPEYLKEWYKKHPDKYKEYGGRKDKNKLRARRRTNYAISTGLLKVKPCEKCGDKKSQAHHENYNKPLEVRWLCLVCHKLAHGGKFN